MQEPVERTFSHFRFNEDAAATGGKRQKAQSIHPQSCLAPGLTGSRFGQ